MAQKSPRRPSPSRGLKDFVIVCRRERRPPQSHRPPAHRYPATPRRRHDRLRRTRRPVVHYSVYKARRCGFYKGCGIHRVPGMRRTARSQTQGDGKMAQIETYTITVAPSTRPGKVTAHSSDGHSLTTSTPLLDGARYWQALGAPSTAAIVTTWSSGPGHWALRSTIRYAASLTVMGDRFKRVE